MMTEPFGHALSTREGRGYEASGRSYSQAPYLSRTKVPGRTFSPRPGEDRSDVGGAAQFNNIGPVPLSPARVHRLGRGREACLQMLV